MEAKKTKYITTTLPYVNAEPHIGFAMEVVQADALARYYRSLGHPVFFNTGTDEHGQKIAQKADGEGVDRQAYVDQYASIFSTLKDGLNLSYDAFIRTTSSQHKAAAQALWQRCQEAGDIYKKSFKGLYCVGDEMFLRESDLIDGRCPNHPNQEPIELEEENYFFRLSKYQDALIELLSNPASVTPDWQRQWALDFVSQGLEDLSISRQKNRMDWGVPVPGDDEHVMYVWFDALTNYISTLGWPQEDGDYKKFWIEGDTLQLAGKDQVRFQSIIFQAMLLSANLKPTDTIFYHGFINSGGQKMSKSLGNVIAPKELVARYGTDATRYLLLRHVHPFDDSDLTWEKMDEYYTANLVNGLGNLVSRVMKMAETHLEGPIDTTQDVAFISGYHHVCESYNFQSALDALWKEIQKLDEKITETEPFKLVKENKTAAQQIIIELVEGIGLLTTYLQPFMPATAAKILEAVRTNTKPENLFPRLDS